MYVSMRIPVPAVNTDSENVVFPTAPQIFWVAASEIGNKPDF